VGKTTYELKSNDGNVKSYEFTSTAAAPTVNPKKPQAKKPPKKQTKNTSVSAPVKKKVTAPAAKKKSPVKAKPAVKTKEAKAAAKEEKPNVHTIKDRSVVPIPFTIIFIAVIATIMFMAIIMSFVNINEYTIKNDSLQVKIGRLEKEYKELSFSLEKKNNLRVIEQRAKELGMVKLDQLQKEYISIKNEDRIEVMDTKKSAQDVISGMFENINKNIKNLVEYIE